MDGLRGIQRSLECLSMNVTEVRWVRQNRVSYQSPSRDGLFPQIQKATRGDSMNRHLSKMFSAITILALILMGLPAGGVLAASTGVFINEIHYDNAGTDTGEAIEIA